MHQVILNSRHFLFTLLLLLCLIEDASGDAVFKVQMRKHALLRPTDSVVAFTERKKLVVLVTDSHGIGRATLFLVSGQWPETATLKFRYGPNRGFHSLENLVITTNRLQIQSSGSTAAKMPFYFADVQGQFHLSDTAAGELTVSINQQPEALEVELPAYTLVGSRQVEIAWIDAYR
ncbi:hypothetical protein BN873_590002 [Candidatus Competibacter denitrificans Run_A_D11]|uniref:Uncharacterized protein n=1 Tax=Candidatus Competibacter denitrificans Run_A_D11 TaxID=1400863 RepID=W6M791_9GAMM|nr:hypothetical protein [Candidatus Competibacter denitrificans]CDI03552.1 hypothetical protein BN873_590002 [Candidatus Competibacter denitrificans Run_A_D11]